MLRRQLLQARFQLPHFLSDLRLALRIGLGTGRVERILQRHEFDQLAPPQRVERGVVRDPEQPGAKLRLGLPLRQRLPGLNESVLRQLQRVVVRSEHAQQIAVNAILMAPHQFGKCFPITRLRAPYPVFVRAIGGQHTDHLML
jgi:hypothetical protein